jgi:two-component system response regulator NreC
MNMGNRVILVEDHKLVRDGIRAIIERNGEFRVVGEADNSAEALRIARSVPSDLALVDIGLPDLSGIEVTREILRQVSGIRVIVISVYDDGETIFAALRSGAQGFVLKKGSASELMEALRTVARGGTYFSSQVSDQVMDRIRRDDTDSMKSRPILSKLTAREMEILRLVAAGKSSKEIAVILDLAVETIRSYRKAMMRKLGVNNVASLIQIAVSQGLTPWSRRAPGA